MNELLLVSHSSSRQWVGRRRPEDPSPGSPGATKTSTGLKTSRGYLVDYDADLAASRMFFKSDRCAALPCSYFVGQREHTGCVRDTQKGLPKKGWTHNARLDPRQIDELVKMRKSGKTFRECGELFGVSARSARNYFTTATALDPPSI